MSAKSFAICEIFRSPQASGLSLVSGSSRQACVSGQVQAPNEGRWYATGMCLATGGGGQGLFERPTPQSSGKSRDPEMCPTTTGEGGGGAVGAHPPTHPPCHQQPKKGRTFLLAPLAPTQPPQNVPPPQEGGGDHPEVSTTSPHPRPIGQTLSGSLVRSAHACVSCIAHCRLTMHTFVQRSLPRQQAAVSFTAPAQHHVPARQGTGTSTAQHAEAAVSRPLLSDTGGGEGW